MYPLRMRGFAQQGYAPASFVACQRGSHQLCRSQERNSPSYVDLYAQAIDERRTGQRSVPQDDFRPEHHISEDLEPVANSTVAPPQAPKQPRLIGLKEVQQSLLLQGLEQQQRTGGGTQVVGVATLRSTDDEEDGQPEASGTTRLSVDEFLARADQHLTKMEANPPVAAKVMYNISEGPIGKATSEVFSTTVQLSAEVGKKALQIAAPASAWMAKEGFKAAFGMLRNNNKKKQPK